MSFFKKFFGTTDEDESDDKNANYNDLVDSNLSIDERFTSEFKKNGGKFIYCENLDEVHEQFLNILEENDWFESETLCFDPTLFEMLDENKLSYNNLSAPKFLFATCENLIAEEGSVLFSSKQIKQNKPNELPSNIVIFATTNQIMETKSDGLQDIKRKYNTDYPTNITTIKYFKESKQDDFLYYGSSPKNLYLLLLENQ